jgi:hypothetical protein
MRTLSNVELQRTALLTKNSIEFALLEPTQTALIKSIIDATAPVRAFLKDTHLHNYETQTQGPEAKKLIPATLLRETRSLQSTASLYRPQSKTGDPRIWFKDLGNYAHPNDILALFEFDKRIYVLNITQIDVQSLIEGPRSNLLKDLIIGINQAGNVIPMELLALLKKIARRGPIPAEKSLKADTAIGRTLETQLGININSSKQPDYKGIEIKSFRSERNNRKNLFAQVPDWSLSKFKSSAEILNAFGYLRESDFRLYCSVSTTKRNSQGLMFRLDNNAGNLIENSDQPRYQDFAIWPLNLLHNRLLEKHQETFWVEATSSIINGVEHFLFTTVEHTKKPIIAQFDMLLGQGIITMDHLIKRSASNRVSEKGPLFKIEPSGIGFLFPPSQTYRLI